MQAATRLLSRTRSNTEYTDRFTHRSRTMKHFEYEDLPCFRTDFEAA